ncbi:MAG: hypothetical protein U1E17_20320 [Geminicoccaceae bacterium]
MRGLAAAMLAALVAAALPAWAADAVKVGPDEVKSQLVGKIWQVKLPDGGSAVENFKADGTVTISGGLNDRGYWRLWEEGYCTTWFRMRNGAERCFTLDRTADGQYRVYKPDGDISMTILSTAVPPP